MRQSDIGILEEGSAASLDFHRLARIGGQGQTVVPTAIQKADTLELLYVGYVNEEALLETLRSKKVVLWSTSRNALWRKGATSGDFLDLVEIRVKLRTELVTLPRPACSTRGMSHSRSVWQDQALVLLSARRS